MKTYIALLIACLALSGCKGPAGSAGSAGATGPVGPQGEKGDTGDITDQGVDTLFQIQEFNGIITNSSLFLVNIGSISSAAIVNAYFAFSGSPLIFNELGQPTGDNSVSIDPWASVSFLTGFVNIFNVPVGSLYKVIVLNPVPIPAPLVKHRAYRPGDRLLF